MGERKAIEYLDIDSASPYGKWFNQLNAVAANKITTAVYRLELGNFSNVEPIGEGVSECKIDFGPGYRIYFGIDGDELIFCSEAAARRNKIGMWIMPGNIGDNIN